MIATRETWRWAGIGAGVLGAHLAVAAWLAHTSSRDAGAMPKGVPEPLRIAFVTPAPVATPLAAEPQPVEAPVAPPTSKPKEPPPPTPPPVARAMPTPAPAIPSPVPPSPPSTPRPANAQTVDTTPVDAASEATTSTESPVSTTSTATQAPAVDTAPSGNVAGVDDATRRHAESTWQSTLLGHLEHHRRYPHLAQRRREEGVAYVRFRVDRSGRVLAASLEHGSGVEVLDEEALEVLERAQPVPPPPRELAGDSVEVVVPVHFRLRRR
ncbi:energy transducer TonB family protein [Dokdonella sp. MW10]|uniref:energy transducer TonB family protein n=1 Tax=Dokdonella sp. MW10 TaxID=2992926 RepID=UPI003F7FBAFC